MSQTPLKQWLTGDRWQSLNRHLDEVLGLPEAERAAWIAGLREREPDTAGMLEQLLASGDKAEFASFLEQGAPIVPNEPEPVSLVGKQVGSYVIDLELGRGGMGSVWRAHRADGRFEGNVAIKFVHPVWVGRSGEQRFQREGTLLGRLNHPNIARLLDAGVLEGTQPYLVLEYVQGEPIDIYCDRMSASLEDRVRLFLDVLAAVAHAHSHLVVHRDIKPANIFVTREGTVKLLDFGIAKLLQNDPLEVSVTRTMASALTPQYAAPEQVLGEPVTTATDVFGLGLILYLLLTGKHPVSSNTRSNAEVMHEVVTTEPPRPSSVAGLKEIPKQALQGDLDNILSKALKKAPAERYGSVQAFAADLQRFLADEPVLARPDSFGYRTRKFVRRHKGSVAGAALTALALLAMSAFAVWQAYAARRERDIAQLEARRADAAGDFMVTLLSDLNRSSNTQAQRTYLDHARGLLEQQHFDDPMVLSNLLRYFAARYREFGYVDMSVELLAQSKKAIENTDNPIALAQVGCSLAGSYAGIQRYEESDREIHASLKILAELGSAVRSVVWYDCLVIDSYVGSELLQNRRALESGRKALSYLKEAGRNSGPEYVTALNSLARAEAHSGNFGNALKLIRQIRATESPAAHPKTIGEWIHGYSEAADLLAGGRLLESEQLSGQLQEASKNFALGENTYDIILLRGKALLALGQFKEASELLATLPASWDEDRNSGWDLALTAIESKLRGGDVAGAEHDWEQRLDQLEVLLGSPQKNVAARALRLKGMFAAAHNDFATAEDAFKQAAQLAIDAEGSPTPVLRPVEAAWAVAALQQGNAAGACHHAQNALSRAQAEAVDPASAWIEEAQSLKTQCEQARKRVAS